MRLNATITHFIHPHWGISSPTFQEEEVGQIVDWMHHHKGFMLLDKPGCSYWELWNLLHDIPAAFHRRLVLAQHHELYRLFQVRGLHFHGERPFTPGDYGALTIGTSVNGFEEALRWGDQMHYIFLNLSPAYSPKEIRLFKKNFKGKAVLLDMPRFGIATK